MKARYTAAAAITAAALVLTGCQIGGDKANEQFKDAPRTALINNTAAQVVTMPDGFNNVATKCDHGNRIYVTFHGNSAYGSVAVVPGAGCQ